MATIITKIEAAQRQIDTAIDLWIEERDALSAFTLAFGSLKILMNLYPHKATDEFSAELDKIIGEVGWRSMSGNANFLKHADRDPDAVLVNFDPDLPMPVIGLATLLFRRLNGSYSVKMRALDSWIELVGADELGIDDTDHDPKRVEANKRERDRIKGLSPQEYRREARAYYEFFLANYERVDAEIAQAQSTGMTWKQAADQQFSKLKK